MKIMIVDDHAAMRSMLRNVVSLSVPEPVEIIECENGEEAVEQFSVQNPDCVLMDIQLKSMSGFEATEKIYENDPRALIIFVTSHTISSYRAKAAKLHAKGFVNKDNLSELNPLLQQITLRGGTL